MRDVVWTKIAIGNLRAIRDYIGQFNPHAASKVAAEIILTGDGLVEFPFRGRAVQGGRFREAMTSYPYIIRYRINDDAIAILRVRHMARQ